MPGQVPKRYGKAARFFFVSNIPVGGGDGPGPEISRNFPERFRKLPGNFPNIFGPWVALNPPLHCSHARPPSLGAPGVRQNEKPQERPKIGPRLAQDAPSPLQVNPQTTPRRPKTVSSRRKTTQDGPKRRKEIVRFSYVFVHDFRRHSSILDSFLGSFLDSKSDMLGIHFWIILFVLPEAAQERPRAAQDRPRAAQEQPRAAKNSPRATKSGPRATKSGSRVGKSDPRVAKSSPTAAKSGQERPKSGPEQPKSGHERSRAPKSGPRSAKMMMTMTMMTMMTR